MTTVFEQEIRSQPAILARRSAAGAAAAEAVARSWRNVDYLLVAARGSSDNAAVFFQYLAGQELGLLVALAAPSLYDGPQPIGLTGAGVLVVSQSGRTPGLSQVLENARRQSRPSAALTNDPQSSLALVADHVIELAAGQEVAIAATKTFSTTWHALAQLVSAMRGSWLPGFHELPEDLTEVIEWALASDLAPEVLNAKGGLTVVGRGVGQAVAAEAALKIREVGGLRAEAFSAADYLHGPIGASGAGSTLLVVITEETSDEVAAELVNVSRSFDMRTVTLRPESRGKVRGDVDLVVPGIWPNWSLGLAEVVVGQVLALRVGELRGRPIDTSPGLAKVTLSA